MRNAWKHPPEILVKCLFDRARGVASKEFYTAHTVSDSPSARGNVYLCNVIFMERERERDGGISRKIDRLIRECDYVEFNVI